MCFLLSELDEVLGKHTQGPSVSHQQQRVPDTTNTSGEDTDVDQPRRRVRSRCTFKLKKRYAVGELAQFFVTGPTDAANELSVFYCCVSEGCVGSYSRRIRVNPEFPGTPPFRSRPTVSPRDTWLAGVGLRGQPTPRRRT